ncbi:MAG: hypothetical protein IJT80_02360 [Lachnospiraceae bacterium]|nr:hypothetical protein [Lachnospiraceae bacterium]
MAGFFEDQDREDKRAYKKMVVYFVTAASLVMLLFLTVIYFNTREKQERKRALEKEKQEQMLALEEQRAEDEALGIGESNVRSEDLDFWDMYEKDEDDEPSVSANNDDLVDRKDRPEEVDKPYKPLSFNNIKNDNEDPIMPGDEEKDDEDDGKHIKARAKGKEETWYDIIEDLNKNNYDLKANLNMDEDKLEYKDRAITSKRGVDVSKYQGTIDWAKVKAAGIDFAMIRVGARGYGSAQLMLDDNFVTNIMGARAAGLETGAYFFSQATTEEEAVEEANFTVGALMNYGATYPVAIDVEWIENDRARTDDLTAEERTDLAVKYCETVKAFGYKPMIYATRDMLIAGMLPDKLKDYDVWLSDDYRPEVGTDYPYEFNMWQYTKKGSVDGIPGEVDINISFVNYKEK